MKPVAWKTVSQQAADNGLERAQKDHQSLGQVMSKSKTAKRPLVADRRYGSASRKGGGSKTAPTRKPARRRTKTPARRTLGGAILFAFRWVIGWALALVWRVAWRAALVVAAFVAVSVIYVAAGLPDAMDLVDGRNRGSVTIQDRSGEVFAWRGDQFGGIVTTDTVSAHLQNAVVATEDKRFFRHLGISPRGIASAIRINLREGRGPLSGNGGSTITQQTAKLMCLGVPYDPDVWTTEAAYEADCRTTTLWRKAREAVYALAMEAVYTKDEILTIYLNRAYLGAGSRGFEAAAQRYFGISAAEVDPAQAAMLAGLLKAPSTYAPTANLTRAQDRASLVLGLMGDQGYLTAAQVADARANPAELSQAARQQAGGAFADWVMERGPDFFTGETTEDVVIRTTLDQDIQAAAEEALSWVFENRVREGSEAQAAIVVMSADGAVRAMVGGRETRASGLFNRATQALRQTGSTFKVFVYATALELGWSPLQLVLDDPLTLDIPGSGPWSPSNYDDEFLGPITLTDALATSRNVPAVRLSEEVGRENVRTIAAAFGIESDLALGPALALGASESTLIEMTGAYAGILNGGSAVTPYGLVELSLMGSDVPLMTQSGGIGERVIQPSAAEELTWMMYQVVEQGSGQRARIEGHQIAGKTGTTQAARDAWFIGFSGEYVTGVWMGYDDNTPLTGVTGSGLPAEIWRETMVRVLDGTPPVALPMREPIAPAPAPLTNLPEARDRMFFEMLNRVFGPSNG